ncbi:hypothetical protein ACP4OV_022293 [Aristida adscensionis]
MADAGAGELRMKLVIDAGARRVLYAETSKEVFDYIYSLAHAPDEEHPFDDEDWEHSCFDNFQDSDIVLTRAAMAAAGFPWRLPPPPAPAAPAKRFFICGYGCDGYVTEDPRGVRCPSCGWPMEAELPRGTPGAGTSSSSGDSGAGAGEGGDAPPAPGEPVLCALTDSLEVILMSSPGSAAELVALRSTAAGELEERTVRIGRTEALAIIEAALQTDTALTDAFLGKKKAPDDDA